MSFYELYNLLVKNELKFTKLRLMQDKNEGIGEVLRMQSKEAGFMLRNRQDKLEEYHENIIEKTYVSCWTSTPDAMAMWLLYSPDSSSIRVRTTLDKLTKSIPDTAFNIDFVKSASPGKLLPRIPRVSPVKYVNFKDLHWELKRELREYYARVKDHISNKNGERFPEEPELESLREGLFLKDEAYSHENEYRASFTTFVRNDLSIAEFENIPDSMGKILGHPFLDDARTNNSPSVYHVAVSTDFVDEICFDPRMPAYRRSEMLSIIGNTGVSVIRSDAFGYMIKDIDLTIPED